MKKPTPAQQMVKTANAVFRALSGGAALPAPVAARIAEITEQLPSDPSLIRKMRQAVDSLAAVYRHSDLRAHAQSQRELAHALGHDEKLMLESEHMLFDVLEVRRCLSLMGKSWAGAQANIQSGLAFASTESTEARQTALSLLRCADSALDPDLIAAKDDQRAYAKKAIALLPSLSVSKAENISKVKVTHSNPLIALRRQRSETGLLLDLFRTLWVAMPDIEPRKPKEDRVSRDFSLALGATSQRLDDQNFLVNDSTIDARFVYRFSRLRDLPPSKFIEEHQEELAMACRAIGRNTQRLQTALRTHCTELIRPARVFDRAEGMIHGGRLASLIANPGFTDVYSDVVWEPGAKATITVLKDHSNSMHMSKMKKHVYAAAAVCRLGDAFHRVGLNFEALGYLGDFDHKDFFRRGSSMEWFVRLLILKDYSLPWKIERQFMHAALDKEHFGGSPEGEALWLAYKRILMRPEKNKIIVVVNDGDPSDGALLTRVVERIKKDRLVNLVCVSIHLEEENFYNKGVPQNYYGDKVLTCRDPQKLDEIISLGIQGILFPRFGAKLFRTNAAQVVSDVQRATMP